MFDDDDDDYVDWENKSEEDFFVFVAGFVVRVTRSNSYRNCRHTDIRLEMDFATLPVVVVVVVLAVRSGRTGKHLREVDGHVCVFQSSL